MAGGPPAVQGLLAAGRPAIGPMTWSSASGSMRARTRRTVASAGGRHAPVSGSRRTPSAARTGAGVSWAHSPIAARDLAPASTAATATGRDGKHAGRQVPSAAAVAGVGDLGEVIQQAAALAGRQRHGRGRMGDGGDG